MQTYVKYESEYKIVILRKYANNVVCGVLPHLLGLKYLPTLVSMISRVINNRS